MVHEVFEKNLGGWVLRGCENLFGRAGLFGGFISFLLTRFAKISEGGSTFIPPHPPVCIYAFDCFK
jgi:hypothetical protein